MAIQILDLTHPIETGMFTWPGDPAFSMTPLSQTEDFRANQLTVSDHGGTHIGTAAHFDPAGLDVAGLAPEQLILPGVCVDFSAMCERNPAGLLQIEDILRWENDAGLIPANGVVLVATGWDRYWGEMRQYFGDPEAPLFPGIAPTTIEWLIEERQVSGVGIDTAGIDGSVGTALAANRKLLRENRFHLENLARLSALPTTGFTLYIGALPIRGAGGSPCRVLATWDDGK